MDGTEFPEAINTAFVELVLRQYNRLLKYFAARIPARDEAGDLVHEAYLRLVSIPPDRVIDNDQAYLWSVAKSVLCRHLERSGRSVPLDTEDPAFDQKFAVDPDHDLAVDLETHRTWLRKCWNVLPVKRRAVMELRWFHELSYDEIAARCGVTVHAVHRHLRLGLQRLRQLMQQMDA